MNKTLEALIKALALMNSLKPILDTAINNEAERLGLTREQLHALTKRLTSDTDSITDEDASDKP